MARPAPAEAHRVAQVGRMPAAALDAEQRVSCTIRRRQVAAPSALFQGPGVAFGEAHHLNAEAHAVSGGDPPRG